MFSKIQLSLAEFRKISSSLDMFSQRQVEPSLAKFSQV